MSVLLYSEEFGLNISVDGCAIMQRSRKIEHGKGIM
jgi:hypothetical protein